MSASLSRRSGADRRYCSFWLSLPAVLLPALLRAQSVTLSGTVRDAAGQALPGAVVEAQAVHNAEASVVAVADANGQFTLRFGVAADSLRLSARALGFAEQVLRVPNRAQPLHFALAPSTTQLREVVVKAAPITQQGDTLSYHVASFTDNKDRVIADVLKKLPGLEVEADGRILFEGRPIQKFYINGADLLESRYTLAGNNLPADAVQDVQVLQRHQPVRALAGVQPTEQASLNVQLKRKVTLTGQGRLGVGTAPSARWQANLSPMLFTARQQLLDSYQANNTGQDVAAELRPLGLEDLRQLDDAHNQQVLLTGIQRLGTPPLAPERYRFNNVQLLAANHLLTLPNQTQLRLNASFVHDAQQQNGLARTLYYLPGGQTVELREDQHNRLLSNALQADVALIRNQPRYYLKNTLSFSGTHNKQQGVLRRNAEASGIVQQAYTPYHSITNRLGVVRPVGRRLMQASSLLNYAASPQRLSVQPGPFPQLLQPDSLPYAQAQQQARQSGLFTHNTLQLLTQRGSWSYSAALGFWQEWQRLTSALTTTPWQPPTPALPTANDLRWRRGKYYTEWALSYRSPLLTLRLEAPLSYWQLTATDVDFGVRQRQRFYTAEPALSVRRELGARWHATASSALTTRLSDAPQLLNGYLLRTYRVLERSSLLLNRAQRWHNSAGLYFQNPLTTWFYHASYAYSRTANRVLYRQRLQPGGARVSEALTYANHLRTHTLAVQASKLVRPLHTTFTAQLTGSRSRQPQWLGEAPATVETQTMGTSVRASVAALDWVTTDYRGTLTALRSRVGSAPAAAPTWLQEHHASLTLLRGPHQWLFTADYYATQGAGPPVRTAFVDATYRYTLPTKRKIDLEISGTNLFNTRRYQYAYLSEYLLTQNSFELRPRQVLLSMRASL